MITAYLWASTIPQPSLPSSLNDLSKRANLVNEINFYLFTTINPTTAGMLLENIDIVEKANRVKNMVEKTRTYLSEDIDSNTRANILLRLWTGCIDAAKNIALETRDGVNTPENRSKYFFQIDLFAKIDLIYCAGVEVAPSFKKLHRQHFSFNGVPTNSVVRRYPNDYLLDQDTYRRIQNGK
jgi:hypothetical protein